MITRRQFLITTAAIMANQFLFGCRNPTETLNVIMLQGSVPTQLVGTFRKTLSESNPIKFKPEAQLNIIFNFLETWYKKEQPNNWSLQRLIKFWNRPPKQADLVTLGDYWLSDAIAKDLVQPLEINKLSGWNNLNSQFQKLVTQNGQIYAAPYRWGNTVIAYRKDKFQKFNQDNSVKLEIKDWSDLWRPELAEKISLLDNYREVIGLTLKKLGYSYNTENLNEIPELQSELTKLDKQVKLYSSTKYMQPLVLGDTWATVGWSSDILPVARRYPDKINVVVPTSGTALWADLWVQPKTINSISDRMTTRLKSWIDFCWQNSSAATIMLFTNGIAPSLNQENNAELTKDLKNKQEFINSSLQILAKSEFITPLNPKTEQEYQSLWKNMRN